VPISRTKFPGKTLQQWLVEAVIAHGDSDECLVWPFNLNGRGYGMLRVNMRMQGAHKIAYRRFKGEVSDGMLVCHTCDNPPCFNPRHLFCGTSTDNEQDKKAKHRHLFGVRHHQAKLTDAQVIEMRSLACVTTRQQLADRYDINLRHVFKILRRELWSHL
jgi:hypothetical protein